MEIVVALLEFRMIDAGERDPHVVVGQRASRSQRSKNPLQDGPLHAATRRHEKEPFE